MADAATLPASLLAPVNDLDKAAAGLRGVAPKVEQARKVEQDAYVGQEQEISRQRQEVQDWAQRNPYPKPDIKPWTQKPPENDPVTSFGSWASAFGILASALTKTPLTSALNATAAAMNAYRQRDLEQYQTAYDAWKSNMEVATKQAEWEAQGWKQSLDLMTKDQALGQAYWTAHAAAAQNNTARLLQEAGLFENQMKYAMEVERFATEAPRRTLEMSLVAAQRGLSLAKYAQYKDPAKQDNDPANQIAMARAVAEARDEMADASPKGRLEAEQSKRAIAVTNELDKRIPEDASPEERARMRAQNIRLGLKSTQAAKDLTPQQVVQLQEKRQEVELVLDKMDKVKRSLSKLSFAAGIGGKVGRTAETIGELMGRMDTGERKVLLADVNYVIQNMEHVMTGTKRQVTKADREMLEEMVGIRAPGQLAVDAIKRLESLQESLVPKYELYSRELGEDVEPRGAREPAGVGAPGESAAPEIVYDDKGDAYVKRDGQWVNQVTGRPYAPPTEKKWHR